VWAPRVVVIALLTFVVGVVATWFFLQTRGFLVLLLLSLFIAFALEPAVRHLAARGWRRGVATGFVMLVAVIVVAVFLGAMISLLISQTVVIADKAPVWLDSGAAWLEETLGIAVDQAILEDQSEQILEWVSAWAGDAVGVALGIGSGLIGAVFTSLTMALFVFYLVAEGPKLRDAIVGPFSPERRRLVMAIWDTSLEKTGGYVYSRALLAGISGVFHAIAFAIIGLPSPIAQGLFVGLVSQFVPNIGTFIGGALPVLLALATNPTDALWVLVVLTVYQQFENLVLANRITAQTMNLHPAVSFGSVIVGANLMGATGALLALPVAATIQAFLSSWVAHRRAQHDPPPPEPGQTEA
jgi:predicted PurR-regulated permease PerM